MELKGSMPDKQSTDGPCFDERRWARAQARLIELLAVISVVKVSLLCEDSLTNCLHLPQGDF